MKQVYIVRLQNGAWSLKGDLPNKILRMRFLSWEAAFFHARQLDKKIYQVNKTKVLGLMVA